jgi:hypothetical protein
MVGKPTLILVGREGFECDATLCVIELQVFALVQWCGQICESLENATTRSTKLCFLCRVQ